MPTPEMQAELRIVAEITAKPGKADALRPILLAMLPPSRVEAGCLHYELHEDVHAVGHFFFYERYTDAAAFSFHTSTPHFKQLGPAIAELIAVPAVITQVKLIG